MKTETSRLYPYQEKGVAFLVSRKRAYLADEMRRFRALVKLFRLWRLRSGSVLGESLRCAPRLLGLTGHERWRSGTRPRISQL